MATSLLMIQSLTNQEERKYKLSDFIILENINESSEVFAWCPSFGQMENELFQSILESIKNRMEFRRLTHNGFERDSQVDGLAWFRGVYFFEEGVAAPHRRKKIDDDEPR